MGITHLGADYAARNLSPGGVSPRNAAYANVRSKLDEAPSRKMIQIELQGRLCIEDEELVYPASFLRAI